MPDEQFLIALATDSLIYAPLFIAHQAGFLNATVNFAVMRAFKTDGFAALSFAKTLQEMLSDRNYRPLLIACDPMHANLYNRTFRVSGIEVIVVGILLKKPACWLFDGVDLKQLIAGIKANQFEKIKTNPKGMTADTLARWLLRAGGVDSDRIQAIIDPAKRPGQELDYFRGIATDRVTNNAAVSVDLLTMQQIEHEDGNRGIRYSFSDNEYLEKYLMTTLVTSRTDYQRHQEVIARILAGVNLALDLMKSDTELCRDLLQLHYSSRNESLAPDRMLGAKHLEPLPELRGNYHDALAAAFADRLLTTNSYPDAIIRDEDELEKRLTETVAMYCDVHSEDLKAKVSIDDLATTGVTELVHLPNCQVQGVDRAAIVWGLFCKELGSRTQDEKASPDLSRIIRSIDEWKQTGIPFYDWVVVGRCVCQDKDRNRVLKTGLNELYRQWVTLPTKDPYATLICSPAGAGKTSYVNNIVASITDQFGEPSAQVTLKVGPFATTDDFRRKLEEKLEGLAVLAAPINPAIFFIDEVNKVLDGNYVFVKLLDYLDASDGSHIQLPSGKLLLRTNIFWLFAGAWPTCKAARQQLVNNPRLAGEQGEQGGPDFNRRVQHDFELPGYNEPLERIAKALALTDPIQRSRIVSIEAHLLLLIAMSNFTSSGDIEEKMAETVSNSNGEQTLRLFHAWDDGAVQVFYGRYQSWLNRVPNDPISIHWAAKPMAAGN